MRVELADGFFSDAGEGAAPTGVDGGDGALFRVNQENGNAVGGLHGEEQAGRFCERSVTLAGFVWSRGEGQDDGRMNLF